MEVQGLICFFVGSFVTLVIFATLVLCTLVIFATLVLFVSLRHLIVRSINKNLLYLVNDLIVAMDSCTYKVNEINTLAAA